VRVKVDWDRCHGHGLCAGEAPEVFALRDDGELDVLLERPAEGLRPQVESAVRFCPTRAISIEE
jgi:ferredoxin